MFCCSPQVDEAGPGPARSMHASRVGTRRHAGNHAGAHAGPTSLATRRPAPSHMCRDPSALANDRQQPIVVGIPVCCIVTEALGAKRAPSELEKQSRFVVACDPQPARAWPSRPRPRHSRHSAMDQTGKRLEPSTDTEQKMRPAMPNCIQSARNTDSKSIAEICLKSYKVIVLTPPEALKSYKCVSQSLALSFSR